MALKQRLFGTGAAASATTTSNRNKLRHHRHNSTEGGGLGKNHEARPRSRKNKYLWDKMLSWSLLVLGSVFALIGSYFSVADILESYAS